MFIFFGILPRIHKSHAAEPNGSADPRLGTPALKAAKKRKFDKYTVTAYFQDHGLNARF